MSPAGPPPGVPHSGYATPAPAACRPPPPAPVSRQPSAGLGARRSTSALRPRTRRGDRWSSRWTGGIPSRSCMRWPRGWTWAATASTRCCGYSTRRVCSPRQIPDRFTLWQAQRPEPDRPHERTRPRPWRVGPVDGATSSSVAGGRCRRRSRRPCAMPGSGGSRPGPGRSTTPSWAFGRGPTGRHRLTWWSLLPRTHSTRAARTPGGGTVSPSCRSSQTRGPSSSAPWSGRTPPGHACAVWSCIAPTGTNAGPMYLRRPARTARRSGRSGPSRTLSATGAGIAAMVAVGHLDGRPFPPGLTLELRLPVPRLDHRIWPRHPQCGDHRPYPRASRRVTMSP